MRRRSRANSKVATARSRKAKTLKAVRRGSSSSAGQETEVARSHRERDEALEQLSGVSEILKVISSSSGDLKPVFQTILAKAVGLCHAKFGTLYQSEGDALRTVALHEAPPSFAEERWRNPVIRPSLDSALGRALTTKQTVQIADVRDEPARPDLPPGSTGAQLARLAGARTVVIVPMLKESELIGAIVIYRQEVLPFTDKQVALVQNFAAQAVIAIENARLLNELRESLDQQTATSEVLRVISSSPGEPEPVFRAMLENAVRICNAKFGVLYLYGDGKFRSAALANPSPEFEKFLEKRGEFVPDPRTALGRIIETRQTVQIVDVKTEPAYVDGEPISVAAVNLGGYRTLVSVPMSKENELIGAISIYHQEVRPFTDKQIQLLQNFAAQAVIAIENARLLNELRGRTQDLTEALEQRTATSEVLGVISSSSGELTSVFDTILANALRLCDADMGHVLRAEEGALSVAAMRGGRPEYADFLRERGPWQPAPHGAPAQAMEQKKPIQIADMSQTSGYATGEQATVAAVELGGIRTVLFVPMVADEKAIGAISIYRQEVRPFTEKQIALVQNFAAQAVIAIENTRLLNELRQSLQQQTATADVLKVISRSTFDLQAVLDTLVQSAARLCDAESAAIHRPQGNSYPYVASYGLTQEYDEYMRKHPLVPGRGTVLGRAVTECKPVQVNDVEADSEYTLREGQKLGGFRTVVGIPLLREGVPIGVIMLTRNTVRPFTDKQIELATTFADQAAIAIENVRLFDEIQDKSRQLEEASQHKSQFLANMSHELRTPLNAILGYTELMADGAYGEPSEKMLGILKRLEANGRHLLGLINDVLDLSKIEAGQLALELSDYSVQDIAQTVRSTLEPLAADKKLALKVAMAPELPPGRGDGRRLTQVLINLVGNAIKFTDAGEVAIKAEANNGSFHVSVRDTGPGISAADQAKLFQEFQQADNAITRKKGGTGLGLAISKRIIEMHGGRIWVDSQPGQGSTFAFTLPVLVERQVEPA
jgi:signal transduction histidine kinase